jgi:hypothetical protein
MASVMDWCTCVDAPVKAKGPLTLLDHGDACGFPESRCADSSHHRFVHQSCGLPVEMRFCDCRGEYGFTYDRDRGWWVHVACGWPTRAWYGGNGSPAPPSLAGLKPVTWHTFAVVPKSPKAPWSRLSPMQQAWNDAYAGRWVWD